MTGANAKIKRIYVRQNGQEKQVRPYRFNPGTNTIAYYPLTASTTVNEMSGKGKTLTNSGVTFGTYQGVDCAYLDGSHFLYNTSQFGISGSNPFTVSIWCYYIYVSFVRSNPRFYGGEGTNTNIGIYINHNDKTIGYNPGTQTSIGITQNGWCNLIVTYNGTNALLYKNGANVYSYSIGSYSTLNGPLGIGKYYYGGNNQYRKGGLSEFIMENKVWTATDISNYYNQTKSNYGL